MSSLMQKHFTLWKRWALKNLMKWLKNAFINGQLQKHFKRKNTWKRAGKYSKEK